MTEMKRNPKEDNRGTTLAEMIVTFALIGIFLASAVAVISSAVVMHSEITAAMYAQTVSETLLDKVIGELAAAQPVGERAMVIGEGAAEDAAVCNGISFYDRDRQKAVYSVQEGLLVLHYDDAEGDLDKEDVPVLEGQNKKAAPRDWKLDEKAYMGFRIVQMQIHRLEEGNVLEVRLRIQNQKTGFEYAVSRCTACYNFKSEEDCRKIIEADKTTL